MLCQLSLCGMHQMIENLILCLFQKMISQTDQQINGVKYQLTSVEITGMKMFRSGVIYFLVLYLNLSQGCLTSYTRNERHSANQSQNSQKRQGRNIDLFSVPGWCINDRTGKRVPQKSAWTVQCATVIPKRDVRVLGLSDQLYGSRWWWLS